MQLARISPGKKYSPSGRQVDYPCELFCQHCSGSFQDVATAEDQSVLGLPCANRSSEVIRFAGGR